MKAGARIPRRKVSGVLLFDKPLGLSSNAALQQVKRLYCAEKAGHTGSLDPLATGMLPICLGEATKLSGVLLDADKRYRATVRLGEQTSTGDGEGEVIAHSDASAVKREDLAAVLPRFLGSQQQIPPMHSALKRDGQPLYALAREGITVEREPRTVEIQELMLLSFAPGEFEFEVRCSKGTYIRTLAEDIAAALGQRAHLSSLRRTGVAPFWDERPLTLEELEAVAADQAALDRLLMSPAAALRHWPRVQADAVRAAALASGRVQRFAGVVRESRLAVLDTEQRLLGLASSDAEGWVQPQRWLHVDAANL